MRVRRAGDGETEPAMVVTHEYQMGDRVNPVLVFNTNDQRKDFQRANKAKRIEEAKAAEANQRRSK